MYYKCRSLRSAHDTVLSLSAVLYMSRCQYSWEPATTSDFSSAHHVQMSFEMVLLSIAEWPCLYQHGETLETQFDVSKCFLYLLVDCKGLRKHALGKTHFTNCYSSTSLFPYSPAGVQHSPCKSFYVDGWETRSYLFCNCQFWLLHFPCRSRGCKGHIRWTWSRQWLLWEPIRDQPLLWGWHWLPRIWVCLPHWFFPS